MEEHKHLAQEEYFWRLAFAKIGYLRQLKIIRNSLPRPKSYLLLILFIGKLYFMKKKKLCQNSHQLHKIH